MKRTTQVIVIALVALILIAILVLSVIGAISGNMFGLFGWEVVTNFFLGLTAEQIILFLVAGVLTYAPGFGTKLLNYLKDAAGLSDLVAHRFIVFMIMLISATVLIVTGSMNLNGLEFNVVNLATLVGEVYLLSQLAYKRWFPKPA